MLGLGSVTTSATDSVDGDSRASTANEDVNSSTTPATVNATNYKAPTVDANQFDFGRLGDVTDQVLNDLLPAGQEESLVDNIFSELGQLESLLQR